MKSNRRFLSVILMILMLLCAGVGAYAEDVTGEWYAEMYGMVMKLTVNADNTYVLETGGDAMTGAWTLEGETLYMDKGTEAEGTFAYDAAAQALDMGDGLIFARTAIEAWAPAAVRAEAALEDFAGIWKASYVNCFGALLPVDAAGVYMDADIAGAAVSLTVTFMDAQTYAGEAVLEGNALTLLAPAKDEYSKDMTFAANALEDGSICITMELFSEPATFYLEKAGKTE